MPGEMRYLPSFGVVRPLTWTTTIPYPLSGPDGSGAVFDRFIPASPDVALIAPASGEPGVHIPTSLWNVGEAGGFTVEPDRIRAEWACYAQQVNNTLKDFLAQADDKFHAESLPICFHAVGEILADGIRVSGPIWKDDFFAFVAAVVAANPAVRGETNKIGAFFTPENLAAMHRLALVFPRDYLESLAPHLILATREPWTLLREIVAIDDPYERIYYAEMCAQDRWNLTAFRHHHKMGRFHTHTMARLDADRLCGALVSLSRGDRSEWIYRDLLRFDFLNLSENEFKAMNEPREFQKLLLEHVDDIIDELGEREFNYNYSQPTFPARDDHDDKREPRLDILTYVNDGADHYPVVIELKKGAFDAKVFQQCERYLAVMKGPENWRGRIPAGYLKRNVRKALVMALVTKVDRELEDIMRVGLKGDGHRGAIFVTVYTYSKPPSEFLEKTIGVQLRASDERSVRERHRLLQLEILPPTLVADDDHMGELFRAIMGNVTPSTETSIQPDRDNTLPF